jgi:peptidoglycan hydrolase CwlO-like protein
LRELEIEQNGLSSYVNQIDELKTKVYDLECTVAELQNKFSQYEKNIK